MNLRHVIAWLPGLLAMAGAFAGDIYSWRDAEGHLHFSDSAPAGSLDVQKRRTRGTADTPAVPPPGSSAKPSSLAEKNLEFRKRRTEVADAQAKADKDKADAIQREENCRNLRANLASLESGQALARVNEKGEREVIDDSRRQADMARTRQLLEQSCK